MDLIRGVAARTISAMPDSIFLVGDDGVLTEASSAAYDAEAELQTLLADNPHLLPGAQINRDRPPRWLLVKREAGVPEHEGGGSWWSIDHLLVDQDAMPTFVEVKRASDTRARREVVAQMLDYAANGSVFWTPAQLRGWFEATHPDGATERLLSFLDPSDGDPDVMAETFWQAVGANLKEGRIRLVFVADEIPASLQRLVEFLNEQMPRVEVLAVEIRQYRSGANQRGALVPRLIGQTSRAQAAKKQAAPAASRGTPWTPEEVMEAITEVAGTDGAAVAKTVIDWAAANPHIQVTGGAGVSYPSVMMSADSGRDSGRYQGVLVLYGSPVGEHPCLEIRVKRMCSAPPYASAEDQQRLIRALQSLGIPRLDSEPVLAGKRPNIPLDQLTGDRLEHLLSVVDQWIAEVRAATT
jgi:hypothetical protein